MTAEATRWKIGKNSTFRQIWRASYLSRGIYEGINITIIRESFWKLNATSGVSCEQNQKSKCWLNLFRETSHFCRHESDSNHNTVNSHISLTIIQETEEKSSHRERRSWGRKSWFHNQRGMVAWTKVTEPDSQKRYHSINCLSNTEKTTEV